MSHRDPTSGADLFSMAVLVEGGLVLVALVVGWFVGQPPLGAIDWTIGGLLLGLAAAVPMVAGLALLERYPVGPLKELSDVVERSLVPLFRQSTVIELAVICALAGLGEEMLFRGVVQAGLAHRWSGPWLALLVASVLFGLAHPITPAYAVVAGVIGGYLGWLLVATDNLLVPIVAHGAYDFVALIYLLRASAETPTSTSEPASDEWLI